MTEQKNIRRCKKLLLFAGGWTVIGVLAVTPVLSQAQSGATVPTSSGATAPTFEVAAIKTTDPHEVRARLVVEQDRFVTVNQTLVDLIRFAYDLNSSDRRISGGPNWVGSAKFDIQAKADGALVESLQKLPPQQRINEVRLMVQRLLADRFKLKVHHEMRELPVYVLVTAKGGAKLKPSTDTEVKLSELGITSTRGHIEGRKAKVVMLTDILGFQRETGSRKVLDKTGLAGEYDFTLRWTQETEPGEPAPADATWPSLFTALQEQLGLRLELTKGPMDTIVIDYADMPSEN